MKIQQLTRQLQLEVDTGYLYQRLAILQQDENLQQVLNGLSQIEHRHAEQILQMIQQQFPDHPTVIPAPSLKVKIQIWLGKYFGYNSIIENLLDTEKHLAANSVNKKLQSDQPLNGSEDNHVRIIEAVHQHSQMNDRKGFWSGVKNRHQVGGGNALRAAVLGANDGMVSNMSLVMGVAGANVSNQTVLLTGIAGLLAGSISMALGEWLSVQSAKELNQRQIEIETEELANSPEEEKQELILLYQAKGMDKVSAAELAEKQFLTKEEAIQALVREELGVNPQELEGAPLQAALTSFLLFSIGAIIPVFPYFFLAGIHAFYGSLIASIIGLFILGAAVTLFTGKSALWAGIRHILFGLTASGVTYTIGAWIGVSLSG